MSTIRSICVYCGSSPGNDPAFVEAGETLGAALADAGLTLVYGGGLNGVMGAVARGAMARKGKIAAIIPDFLINREANQAAHEIFEDLTVTTTMHERKQQMFERSDAFVALPGGIGTVEEIVEIMTWAQIGRHTKPIAFANINGFWNPFLDCIEGLRTSGFIHSGNLVKPLVINHAADIVPAIVAAGVKARGDQDRIKSVTDKM